MKENSVLCAVVSGTRKDEQRLLIPAYFVREGSVKVNGAPLMEIQLGPSVSRDPFLQFRFAVKRGDVLQVVFCDNREDLFTAETVVSIEIKLSIPFFLFDSLIAFFFYK